MAQATLPPWIQALQQRDPEFVASYMAQRERILKDGAIPAKYKILMTMIVDALLSHPDGVATIANRARAAGASESEIQEAVEVPGPTLSHHLDILRRAGLVQSRREERYIYYSVRRDTATALVRLLTACC